MIRKALLLTVSTALLSQASFAFIYGWKECPGLKQGHYDLDVSRSGSELILGGSYRDGGGVRWTLSGVWPSDAFTQTGAPLNRLVQNEIMTASDRLYSVYSSKDSAHCFYATASNYGVEIYRSK